MCVIIVTRKPHIIYVIIAKETLCHIHHSCQGMSHFVMYVIIVKETSYMSYLSREHHMCHHCHHERVVIMFFLIVTTVTVIRMFPAVITIVMKDHVLTSLSSSQRPAFNLWTIYNLDHISETFNKIFSPLGP